MEKGEKRKEVRTEFWEMLNLTGWGCLKDGKGLSGKDENKISVRYEKNQEHFVSQCFNIHFTLTATLDERIDSYFIFTYWVNTCDSQRLDISIIIKLVSSKNMPRTTCLLRPRPKTSTEKKNVLK